jgi:quercetin dioxygenase-like cupin family protein
VKGECRQIINGVPYLLKEGDILLMDTGSAHSIEALGKGRSAFEHPLQQ